MSVEKLEQLLCSFTGRMYCCLTGRGATGIYLAVAALGRETGKVVLPDIVCPSVANSVIYAGLEPVFCDINLRDYTLDLCALERMLVQNDDVVAVLPVHLYGHPADMNAITKLCRPRGVAVIEDAAQALGGTFKKRPLGSYGDISILSFGHTKILDAGGGGAVLTDDPEIYKSLCELQQQLLPPAENIHVTAAEYREVYYTIQPLAERNPDLNDLFIPLPNIYRNLYVYAPVEATVEKILAGFSGLSILLEQRRVRAELYRRLLNHPDVEHPDYEEGCVPWRYSFILRNERVCGITESLRKAKINVSNWYPPLHPRYLSGKRQDSSSFHNANYLAHHIMNLWVEPCVQLSEIERTCETLLNFLTKE